MVTAMRLMWGEDETRQWLLDMQANEPGIFPKNTPIVAAAGAGEVAVGLVNHYYLHRFIQEEGDDFAARNLFLKNGGPDSLVMVAGAGILNTGENRDNAESFMPLLALQGSPAILRGPDLRVPPRRGSKDTPPASAHRYAQRPRHRPQPGFSDLQGTDALLRETGVIP